MGIFKKCFLNEKHHLPVLDGPVSHFIRHAYRGGVVNVFKPKLKGGFIYDINSLYPHAMTMDMPTGTPISLYKPKLDDVFGFFQAKITTPKDYTNPF
jgi:hypothetical protein